MGRSVSTPRNAILVAYRHTEVEDSLEWEFVVEGIQESAKSCWKSFDNCDEWLGREDHAILENGLAYIGISQYCGLTAIWLAPKDDECNLCNGFASRIENRFNQLFGEFRRIGTFSNGEGVYERIA